MPAGKELFKLWGLLGMQGVDTTSKQLKQIDKQVRKSQKELDRLGRRAAATGKVLIKAFTLPLLLVGAAVTKISADFDAALTKSTAIMGDLSDTMRKDLKNAAIAVSKVLSFSAKEAAEAYFFLASAGKTAAQSIKLLPIVARFAQAGTFDLARATDLLTDAQSALGLSSKDMTKDMENMIRVSDVLVKANTISNATVAEFSESLTNKAAAALVNVNKEIEEGVAVLAAFADRGVKGQIAGQRLTMMINGMTDAQQRNSKEWKNQGIALFDADEEMRDFADVIEDFENKLGPMTTEMKASTLAALGFNVKTKDSVLTLMGASGAIREYKVELKKAAGITDEVARKQLNTFWKQIGLIKDRLIAVGLTAEGFASIGNKVLLPIFDKLVSMAESLNKWWNDLDVTMRRTVTGFIIIAAALGPVVFLIGKLIVFSKFLIPLFVALKTGTLSWAGAMAVLQKSVLSITLIVAALVALGWFWFSQWDTMSVQLEALWAKVNLFIARGVNGIVQAITDGMLKIMDMLSKVSGAVPGLTDKLNKAKIGILKFKAELFRSLGKQRILTNAINEQAEATDNLSEMMKKAVKEGKKVLGLKEDETKVTKGLTLAEKAALKAKREALATQREQFDQKILDQMAKLGADKFELLELERVKAVAEAKKLKADVDAVDKFYSERKKELLAEEQKARDEFNASTKAQIEQMTLTKLDLLEIEKQAALQKADELGAEKQEINTLYDLKERDLKDQLRKKEEAKDEQALRKRFRQASTLGNKLNNVLGKFSDNKIKRLDLEEKRQIEAIQNSQMTEEEKEAAIEKIEETTEKKRQKLERQRAIREKAAALFNIGINTASAVVEALPNIPLSLVIGALGLAEGVAVATAPLPFAEGVLVQGSDRGVNALIGEKNTDEVVFPLEKGVGLFIDGLLERLSEIELPTFGAPELAGAAAAPAGDVHLHIGTFIGDKRGLKELERRLDTIRIAENQRKGF